MSTETRTLNINSISLPIPLTPTPPLEPASTKTQTTKEPEEEQLLSKCIYADDPITEFNKSYSQILLEKQQNHKKNHNYLSYKLNQLYYQYIYSTPIAILSLGETIWFNLVVLSLIVVTSYYICWILPQMMLNGFEKFYYYLTGYSFKFSNIIMGSGDSNSSVLKFLNSLLFLNLKNNASSLFLNNNYNNDGVEFLRNVQ
ncbi:hypothetical protein KGF54_000429 [Candida jiufengensis]|uniref:uncharacterized protein n=1 Tax=Candida jiufengensis TaxID=497108 RepID=UPI0022253FCE|nr:uncharacterized protein KGF54_000429 [Candida jiufengensis]KAI5956812.1 hypothetical protein KGF54_000429 [Candida jiufengensis]